jgi:solute carrier family 25 (mitochondrial phosphate transporter), member 23/24/25/41
VLAFWTGNGLSVAKIFPESAIKFFTYESSVRYSMFMCARWSCLLSSLFQKRFLGKYWDKVEDSKDISGASRFIAGGMGGITSQLSAYRVCYHWHVSILVNVPRYLPC